MKYVKNYKCTLCGKTFEKYEKIYTCSACKDSGILDVEYDYASLKDVLTKDFFKRNEDYSIWRYKELISVDPQYIKNTLNVGWTPLYEAKRLANIVGVNQLMIKDDGLNPTGSLKDRPSVVAAVKAIEQGYNTVACSSTGNAASSMAGNAARLGLSTVIFVPERAPQGKLAQLLIYGAKVILVKGDYRATYELSKLAIDRWGWYNRNAAINPHLVEGKKTVSLEIAEQMNWEVSDWVAVSVGDGCTIGGVYKGFYDLFSLGLISKIPKILGVQSDGCCPFYNAYTSDGILKPTEENTLADSISVGIPRNPIKGLDAVKKSNGTWITVTDEAILEAMKTLGSSEGMFGEPAGVTGLAGTIKAVKEGIIKPHETVTMIISGNGLKDVKNALRAAPEPIKCEPNIESLIPYIES